MRLLVCIKQIPGDGAQYSESSGDLPWTSAPMQLDPFSAYALEGAARIRDRLPDTQIIALGLGQCGEVLRECLAIAADAAWLLEHPPLEPLSGSWCLFRAVQKLETAGVFDGIFCGDQSVLGDCRPLGSELAHWLNRPKITGVLEAEVCENGFLARRRGTDAEERLWAPLPCLLTFTRPDYALRSPTMPRYLAANRAEILTLPNELPPPEKVFPKMEVRQICLPQPKKDRVILRAERGETVAAHMIRALSAAGLIEGGRTI